MYMTREQGDPLGQARRGRYLRLSPLPVVGLAALLILPWVIVFHRYAKPGQGAPVSAGLVPSTSPTTSSSRPVQEGPWGDLEYTAITIEPPEDAVHRFETVSTALWYFRDCTGEEL